MIKVVSFLYDTLGHTSFEYNLKNNINFYFSGVEYQIKRFSEFRSQNIFIRLLVKCLTFDLEWNSNEQFFKRFRSEFCLSILGFIEVRKNINRKDIHCFVIRTQSIALLSSSFLKKHNFITTIDITTAQLANFQRKKSYQPIIYLEKKVFNSCKHIITNSEYARTSVINDYQIHPDKVSCIYPSVNEKFFNPRLKENSGIKKIIFVGNDFTRKGGHDLVKIFNQSFKDTYKLLIVSGSPEAAQYRDYPGIEVHSAIQPLSDKLVELYKSSHVFVLPTYEEAYGLVFSEAMAAGLPCIGTNIMAIPELIKQGENGYLIHPGDLVALEKAIHDILSDEAKLVDMASKAYSFACSMFRPQKNTEKFVEVLDQISRAKHAS